MNLEEQTTGSINIKIEASIIFDNKDEEVDIPVEDGDNGNEPGGNTPEPQPGNGPSVILPEDFTYSLSGNPAKPVSADAILKTPAGLKSAKVKISTDNKDFEKTLGDVPFDTPGALLSGAELIGNNGIQGLFDQIQLKDEEGQPKKTPVEKETEYVFPISAYFTFLDMYEGLHQFTITLIDVNGKTIEDTLTIKITK